MQVSWKEIVAASVILGIMSLQEYTISKQQDTLEGLLSISSMTVQLEAEQERKLWDLHHRVLALEKEDQRIMAHVKWFVMRRSGTAELRRMERAIERLEGGDVE